MPKVNYTAAKGLYQDSGSGFEVTGVAIQPSIKTLGVQVVQVAVLDGAQDGSDGSGSDMNGTYFSVYNANGKVTIWFTSSDNADPATRPTVEDTIEYVMVEVVDATAVAAVAAALEVALEAADIGLTVNDGADLDATAHADGSFAIEGSTPYEAAGTADNGNMTGAVTQSFAGAGDSESFALETHGVSILDCTQLGEMEAATAYTLGAGSHVGAVKVITRSDTEGQNQTVTYTGYVSASDDGLASVTATFAYSADRTMLLALVWDGNGWMVFGKAPGAGVVVA